MTTWIAPPDLMNLDYLRRMHSSASGLTVRVRAGSTHTQLDCLCIVNGRLPRYLLEVWCPTLLADFFEKFRASCLAHYSFDAVHYYIAPGLAWDAALKMTHASLELITDIDLYHFIQDSIRGGISMITTRYAQANSPTLPGYDASRPHVNLIYLDANNLYGWAMSQPLPTGGFRFLQPDEVDALAPVRDAKDGYIYEVDLHYPQHLHDAHDDYPLAPEIDRDMYSPAQHATFPQTAP